MAPLFSGKADWFWKILWAFFVGFPSGKPEHCGNWEGKFSGSLRGKSTAVCREKGAGLSLVFLLVTRG